MLSIQPILDGELLRAFAAFSQTLNFTHAAALVGLSQPALFERVKRLSQQLDAPLYIREGRALVLTELGVQVASFAKDMLGRSQTFLDSLDSHCTESVTLAAGEGSYLYLLGQALARFTAEDVGALVPLTLGGPSAAEAVRTGEAQLAVGVFDLIPRRLVAKDIVRTPLCAAMSRRHRLAKRRSIKLSELGDERLILAPEGRKQRDVVGRAIASIGATIAPPIEADGWALMLSYAQAGLGVAVVNGICDAPKGTVLRPIPELGTVTYRLLYRKSAELGPAAERLKALILA